MTHPRFELMNGACHATNISIHANATYQAAGVLVSGLSFACLAVLQTSRCCFELHLCYVHGIIRGGHVVLSLTSIARPSPCAHEVQSAGLCLSDVLALTVAV